MRIARSCVALVALAAAGCGSTPEGGADHAAADLSATGLAEACSAPVRSDDGAFFALDLCPTAKAPGRVVRVAIASGEQTEIATYPATDRIEQLGAKGPHVYFATKHVVDASGRATAGIDVTVRDWSLTAGRTVAASAPPGVTGSFGALRTLVLTADGSHVAFSASADAGAGALATFLLVAAVNGTSAPVALDLAIPSGALRWSTAGGALVGHDPDDAFTGETLVLVETGGEAVATLAGKRHVALSSYAFGQGGTRPQEPFDGVRVVGFKQTEADGSVVGTVDPKTGEEKVLDAAPILRVVTDLGPDILYARVTQPEGTGGFVRDLVKQPRAGGAKTVLLSGEGPSFDALRYGFDPLAVSKTGAFAVFGTRNAAGADERWLVKLDGGSPAVKLPPKVTVREQIGDRVLLEDASAIAAAFVLLDLASGTQSPLGPATAGAFASLVGNGSLVELQECTTDAGTVGTSVRHTTGQASDTSECTWMPWASIPLSAPGSDAIVFYSSWGPFPDYRYDVGVVKP
jgi:hypothetical protein